MSNLIDTITETHLGVEYAIEIHLDENMGEPWKEHDGHGIVSEWERRDKRPGEMVLHSDRHSKRFYDYTATLEVARRDGWGLSPESLAKLAATLGRKPTAREITSEAVLHDFNHLRAWCNDEWQWLGYIVKIDDENIDSCWGFDAREYMIEQATQAAESHIERVRLIETETQLAECIP